MTRKLTNCNAEKPSEVILFTVKVLAEKFVVSLHCVKLDLDVSQCIVINMFARNEKVKVLCHYMVFLDFQRIL